MPAFADSCLHLSLDENEIVALFIFSPCPPSIPDVNMIYTGHFAPCHGVPPPLAGAVEKYGTSHY